MFKICRWKFDAYVVIRCMINNYPTPLYNESSYFYLLSIEKERLRSMFKAVCNLVRKKYSQ